MHRRWFSCKQSQAFTAGTRHTNCTRVTGKKVMGLMGLASIAAQIGDSWTSNSRVQTLRQGIGLTWAQACACDNGSEGIAMQKAIVISNYWFL